MPFDDYQQELERQGNIWTKLFGGKPPPGVAPEAPAANDPGLVLNAVLRPRPQTPALNPAMMAKMPAGADPKEWAAAVGRQMQWEKENPQFAGPRKPSSPIPPETGLGPGPDQAQLAQASKAADATAQAQAAGGPAEAAGARPNPMMATPAQARTEAGLPAATGSSAGTPFPNLPSSGQAVPADFAQTIINGPNAMQSFWNPNASGGGGFDVAKALSGQMAPMGMQALGTPTNFDIFQQLNARPQSILEQAGHAFGLPASGQLGGPETAMANNPDFVKFVMGQQGLGLEQAKQALEQSKFGWETGMPKLSSDIIKAGVMGGMTMSDLKDLVQGVQEMYPGMGGRADVGRLNVPGKSNVNVPGDQAQPTAKPPQEYLDWHKKNSAPVNPADKSMTAKRALVGLDGKPLPLADAVQRARSELGEDFVTQNWNTIWPHLASNYPEADKTGLESRNPFSLMGDVWTETTGQPSSEMKARSYVRKQKGKSEKGSEAFKQFVKYGMIPGISLPADAARRLGFFD